jgi:hypothetical protein
VKTLALAVALARWLSAWDALLVFGRALSMRDPGQELHAIFIDIVYNIAYDFGRMSQRSAQAMSVSPRKIAISSTISGYVLARSLPPE